MLSFLLLLVVQISWQEYRQDTSRRARVMWQGCVNYHSKFWLLHCNVKNVDLHDDLLGLALGAQYSRCYILSPRYAILGFHLKSSLIFFSKIKNYQSYWSFSFMLDVRLSNSSTFWNIQSRPGSSLCKRAWLNFQVCALRDIKMAAPYKAFS